MESDWPRSREPEADPEPSPHPPDRSGRPTSSPTDPSDRNLRQPSRLARPEAPWRPPVGAPSPPRSPQQLPPFGRAHGEARRRSRSPADIPAPMVESRGEGSCRRNNSGRNDALSFATLAERNDVLSFSAERCPVGSHLVLALCQVAWADHSDSDERGYHKPRNGPVVVRVLNTLGPDWEEAVRAAEVSWNKGQ